MLFLVHSGLTIRRRAYPALAPLLVAETTVYKLWVCDDTLWWGVGGVVGLLTALVHRVIGSPSEQAG